MLFTLLFLLANLGFAEGTVTTVTTYVTKTQDERKDTRFTLTEWLRIKERMKMMDVWLAMFGSSKQQSFQPEVNLSYQLTRGETDFGTLEDGSRGRVQFWLTNLVSATTGFRVLNIDLGGEVWQSDSGLLAPLGSDAGIDSGVNAAPMDSESALAAPEDPTTPFLAGRVQHATAGFRLFGKNIQDTSLVFKVGGYRHTIGDTYAAQGQAMGGELCLYLLSFLGAEGSYMQYGQQTELTHGTAFEYSGFLEISLLRLSYGMYESRWTLDGAEAERIERGLIAGAKLHF
jgi:hypothetical protein